MYSFVSDLITCEHMYTRALVSDLINTHTCITAIFFNRNLKAQYLVVDFIQVSMYVSNFSMKILPQISTNAKSQAPVPSSVPMRREASNVNVSQDTSRTLITLPNVKPVKVNL